MIVLLLAWLIWCILHSLLITRKVNELVRAQSSLIQGSYRLLYSLFSFLSLVPLLWYQHSLPQELLFSWSGWLHIPRAILAFYALLLCYGGYQVYDIKYLLGISQWKNYQQKQEVSSLPFRSDGALAYVRHPWYSGALPLLWIVGPVTDINLPIRIILSLYLILGTLLEERKLVEELGEPYIRYQQQVPMLIPWRGRVQ
jgi:protein-S-isoprenylcysteine O-methyltransferase Ste14